MTISLKNIYLLTTLLLSSTSIAAPDYFNIPDIGCLLNSGRFSGYDSLSVNVHDPATKTDGFCGSQFNSTVPNSVQGHPPMEWTKCYTEYGGDSTFAYRVETWINDTNWRVGLRNQYKSPGVKCTKSNAKDCITRYGYVEFNTSAPGYNLYDTTNSRSEMASGEMSAGAGPYLAPVYLQCKACANNKV